MPLKVMRIGFLTSLFLCLVAVSYGQSLGDVARAERLKRQNQNPQTAPKVITNDDLSKHSIDEDEPIAGAHHDDPPSPPLGSKPAEQWKADIAAQRNTVTSLQSAIDNLNRTIHFANGGCVYHCVEHNENQLKKQDQVQRLQGQLDQAKTKLDEMQDQAQREGFGNSVYEP
ncbi:MAG TPA: hypothetical protein VMB18_12750 [Terriglobales bacterium]|nr:hypothetical protein [Terriglobales bacterium]